MSFKLYDYVDGRGINVIADWTRGLQKPQRASLNVKLDLLASQGRDLPPKLLSDTPSPHIKKIRINGSVALRPMLCKGPINNDDEFTLLVGAIEKDRKFVPPNALPTAIARRTEVSIDPTRRCQHEHVR